MKTGVASEFPTLAGNRQKGSRQYPNLDCRGLEEMSHLQNCHLMEESREGTMREEINEGMKEGRNEGRREEMKEGGKK